MPHPLLWLNRIDIPIALPNVQQALNDLSPYFKGIQNSFGESFAQLYSWILVLLSVIGIALVANAIYKYKSSRHVESKSSHQGDDLFKSLLDHLNLTASDRTLLLQVAQDTRLLHPSAFLLSPDMLDWSRKIWIQEKGSGQVTSQQKTQIDTISDKIFGPTHDPVKSQIQNRSAAAATGRE